MFQGRREVGSHQVVEEDSRTPRVIGPISNLRTSDRKFDLLGVRFQNQCGVLVRGTVVGSAQRLRRYGSPSAME
jgi:hypothetical protein